MWSLYVIHDEHAMILSSYDPSTVPCRLVTSVPRQNWNRYLHYNGGSTNVV